MRSSQLARTIVGAIETLPGYNRESGPRWERVSNRDNRDVAWQQRGCLAGGSLVTQIWKDGIVSVSLGYMPPGFDEPSCGILYMFSEMDKVEVVFWRTTIDCQVDRALIQPFCQVVSQLLDERTSNSILVCMQEIVDSKYESEERKMLARIILGDHQWLLAA